MPENRAWLLRKTPGTPFTVRLRKNPQTILVEAIENDRQETVQQYKELLKLSREAGVEIIWGSDAHHVTEMEISSSQLQSLSEAYDFDFESTINQRVDELLQFIQRRKYR